MAKLALPGVVVPALLLLHAPVLGQVAVQQEGPYPRTSDPINVLFILSDQHTTRAMGCYQNGFGGLSESLTPNLDRLAAEGVKFERAYCAAPQCEPSRYSMLTGRWPHHHGLRWNEVWPPLDQTTFPELARRHGYKTATFGKHHMTWFLQPSSTFHDLGFGLIENLGAYENFCQHQGQPPYDAQGQFTQMAGVPQSMMKIGYTDSPNELHPTGFFADRVIDFLERRAKTTGDGLPFACWYSMYSPHPPVLPSGAADPHDWAHLYHPFDALGLPPNQLKIPTTTKLAELQGNFGHTDDAEWREMLSYYYGLITQLDWNVGRVLDRLDELGLAESTLVLYTADHGEMGAEMGCWSKGAGHYEALSHVPLLARLPGVLPGGVVVERPVDAVDLFPTLLEVTGVYASDAERARLDGESLLDVMLGLAPPPAEPPAAFSEFGTAVLPDILQSRMIRRDDLKYVFDEINGGEEELYDLALDPYEIDNEIGAPDPLVQATLDSLRAELAQWWGDPSTHAPQYAVAGPANAPPTPASAPDPPVGALDVDRKVDPRWQPCSAAATQTVYLGMLPSALVPAAELGPMESSFNPGTLASAKRYYWRVDGANDHGTTTGPLWSFTTASGGTGGPGLSADPTPANHAEGVRLSVTLAWIPPADATTQTVHLGIEDGPLMPFGGTLAGDADELSSPQLAAGVRYRWRVDTSDAAGLTAGTVWSFRTDPAGLAERARNPLPLHLDAAASVPSVLRWRPGADALSHDVYFGLTNPPPFLVNQSAPELDPGPLVAGQTYYWRVDERNSCGVRRGTTWRFSCAP